MKYKTHDTICISTQIGCRMSCRFCASTKETFVRNLSAEEMLGQVYEVSKTIHSKISNVVLMGIGEPLENYEEVVRFIRLLNDENGYHMSIRNITLSTCGLVDQMKRLADEKLGIHLTISLHNPFSEERMRIMPITKKYCVEDVLLAADYYFEKTKRRIGFEYTVIRGVNDSNKHLRELVKILKHRNCLLNLIELNPIREYDQKSGSMIQIEQMKEYLNRHGVNTTIRRRQGEDINGACGQLRINSLKGGVN